jgi:hypothetical protein
MLGAPGNEKAHQLAQEGSYRQKTSEAKTLKAKQRSQWRETRLMDISQRETASTNWREKAKSQYTDSVQDTADSTST